MWKGIFFAASAIAGSSATAAYFAAKAYAIEAPEVQPSHVGILTAAVASMGGLAATAFALMTHDLPWILRQWLARRSAHTTGQPRD